MNRIRNACTSSSRGARAVLRHQPSTIPTACCSARWRCGGRRPCCSRLLDPGRRRRGRLGGGGRDRRDRRTPRLDLGTGWSLALGGFAFARLARVRLGRSTRSRDTRRASSCASPNRGPTSPRADGRLSSTAGLRAVRHRSRRFPNAATVLRLADPALRDRFLATDDGSSWAAAGSSSSWRHRPARRLPRSPLAGRVALRQARRPARRPPDARRRRDPALARRQAALVRRADHRPARRDPRPAAEL